MVLEESEKMQASMDTHKVQTQDMVRQMTQTYRAMENGLEETIKEH